MKKIWKIRKDSEAVSPVIATILMVAITVVLAAVLYVMVMGFGGTSSNPPIAGFNAPTKIGTHTYKISVADIDKTTLWSDCKLSIVNGTTAKVSGALAPGPITTTPVEAGVTIVDLGGLADTTIGTGDYIQIVTASGIQYEVALLWGSNNDRIASTTFTST